MVSIKRDSQEAIQAVHDMKNISEEQFTAVNQTDASFKILQTVLIQSFEK